MATVSNLEQAPTDAGRASDLALHADLFVAVPRPKVTAPPLIRPTTLHLNA